MVILMLGCELKKCMVYIGFIVCSIFGCWIILQMFSVVRVLNQSIMIGLNRMLICVVLCFWIRNRLISMISVSGIVQCFRLLKVIFSFFIVDSIEIVGVIMLLLQNSVVLIRLVIIMKVCSLLNGVVVWCVRVDSVIILFLFWLLVCRMKIMYLMEMIQISDQKISDSMLRMLLWLVCILQLLMKIFFRVYKGLVLIFLQQILIVLIIRLMVELECFFDVFLVCVVVLFMKCFFLEKFGKCCVYVVCDVSVEVMDCYDYRRLGS